MENIVVYLSIYNHGTLAHVVSTDVSGAIAYRDHYNYPGINVVVDHVSGDH